MDLNGDGRLDILTGSYSPGHLYAFLRNEDGTFAKGAKLANKDGAEILVGAASTPFAVDWDRDGDLDLLVGEIAGAVFFIANESGSKELKFGAAVKLQQDGKDIVAPGRDSQPVVADWDGDGKHDLVLANGDGSVTWYRNTAENAKQAPTLAAVQELVPMSENMKRSANGPAPTDEIVRGYRAKLCVTDFNGDGTLDLLVGDFGVTMSAAPELTEEQKAEFEALKKQQADLQPKLMEATKRVRDEALAKIGKKPEDKLTQEETKAYAEAYRELVQKDEEYLKVMGEYRKVGEAMRGFQPTATRRGNVWFFAGRKAAPQTGPAPDMGKG